MTNPILHRARALAAADFEANNCNRILSEAAKRGDYDRGTYVTRWLPQAEAELLREREEVSDAE